MKMIVLNFDNKTIKFDNKTIKYYTGGGLKTNLNLDVIDDIEKLILAISHKYLEIVFDNTFVICRRIFDNIYLIESVYQAKETGNYAFSRYIIDSDIGIEIGQLLEEIICR